MEHVSMSDDNMNVKDLDIIDLHTHSTMSDGTDRPEEIVQKAAAGGLRGLALTDHDSIEGNKCAGRIAKEMGIEFLMGIEIGCKDDFGHLHILGLFRELDMAAFNRDIGWIKDARTERNRSILDLLADHDMSISMDELSAFAGDDSIGRLHIAKAMRQKGFVESMGDAFGYLNIGGSCFVPRETFTAEEAIELIKKHGGFSSLAHPFLIPGRNIPIPDILDRVAELDIGGMEVYYVENTGEQTRFLEKESAKRDLLRTGGTDYHGENKPGVQLGIGRGDMRIPYSLMEEILGKL